MDNQKLNPYKSADGKPRLVNSVAAFVDILGYSEYIKTSFKAGNGQQELTRLRDALDVAYNDLKQKTSGTDSPSVLNFQVRTFTDNLVIGCPIPEEIEHDDRFWARSLIDSIVFYIAFLQAELVRQGYLIRGAITIGDLYIDDDIVFGPAILETAEAEKCLAIFPRVILCDAAVKAFKPTGGNQKINDLLIDSDNKIFIDYLDATVMIAYPDDRPFTEFLDGNRTCIVHNLKKFSGQPHIRAKYEWAAAYHNSFCDRYPDLFSEPDKIQTSLLVPLPKEWFLVKEDDTPPEQ